MEQSLGGALSSIICCSWLGPRAAEWDGQITLNNAPPDGCSLLHLAFRRTLKRAEIRKRGRRDFIRDWWWCRRGVILHSPREDPATRPRSLDVDCSRHPNRFDVFLLRGGPRLWLAFSRRAAVHLYLLDLVQFSVRYLNTVTIETCHSHNYHHE